MRAARLVGLLSLAGLLLTATGCCKQVPSVAVREEVLRLDQDLPLSPEGREELLAFLRADGDRRNLRGPPQLPQADARYGPLLTLLASADNLDLEDLAAEGRASTPYRPWFSDKAIRDVIDARDEQPAALTPPCALSDGRFWWVFARQREGRFTRLIVFPAMRAPDEAKEGAR